MARALGFFLARFDAVQAHRWCDANESGHGPALPKDAHGLCLCLLMSPLRPGPSGTASSARPDDQPPPDSTGLARHA